MYFVTNNHASRSVDFEIVNPIEQFGLNSIIEDCGKKEEKWSHRTLLKEIFYVETFVYGNV